MLNAQNLLEKLGQWHERMEDQYNNADATGQILASAATARVGIHAIETFAKITLAAPFTSTVDAEPLQTLPIPSPEDTREILRTLVEAGGSLTEAEEAQAEAHKEQAG